MRDPAVTFIVILAIGLAAGLLFDRLAGPSWLARQFSGESGHHHQRAGGDRRRVHRLSPRGAGGDRQRIADGGNRGGARRGRGAVRLADRPNKRLRLRDALFEVKRKRAADFSADPSPWIDVSDRPQSRLPARADAEADPYAARANADADARTAIVVSAVIVAAAFDVALARRVVVVGILNDDAALPTLPPAASAFVTDHADVFDAVVRHHRDAV